MIPVEQQFVHKPEIGQYGDCQRAVIASLLELPITEVPHFCQEAENEAGKFWELVLNFVYSRGYEYEVCRKEDVLECGYHEISGPSPRGNGVFHAVVGFNGQIVHDPHPSKAGLGGDESEWHYARLEPRT